MEPFERFSEQKLEYLRRRYRGDDLFRTWTRLLCILEQQLHGLNAVEVWSETEMVRQRLLEIKNHRDNDVEFLYGDLMKRHQSKYTVATILTVLFTQMCDAAPDEEDDAAERNPNRAICNVLARLLMLRDIKPFSEKLISAFKSHRYDNEENKIILPVTDYMDVKTPLELMDEEAREQVEKWVEGIEKLTLKIRPFLKIDWEVYKAIWRKICANQEIAFNVPTEKTIENIKVTVEYDGPVQAPIVKGQKIATLIVATQDYKTLTFPLFANESIDKSSFLERITLILRYKVRSFLKHFGV